MLGFLKPKSATIIAESLFESNVISASERDVVKRIVATRDADRQVTWDRPVKFDDAIRRGVYDGLPNRPIR